MEHSLLIRCSDCGGVAKRTYTFALDTIVKTECCHCDYYLVVDFASGKVQEAHTSCTAITLPQKATLVPIAPYRPIWRSPVDFPA